jgi:hypothetical protein
MIVAPGGDVTQSQFKSGHLPHWFFQVYCEDVFTATDMKVYCRGERFFAPTSIIRTLRVLRAFVVNKTN